MQSEKKKCIIFNLWSPVEKHWKEILEDLETDFKIIGAYYTVFKKKQWAEFLVEYYANASDPPGDFTLVNVKAMHNKAASMKKTGQFFLTILVDATNENFLKVTQNGNQWEPAKLGKFKQKTRLKFMQMGYKKFEIAHCFESYIYSDSIMDFLISKCELTEWK